MTEIAIYCLDICIAAPGEYTPTPWPGRDTAVSSCQRAAWDGKVRNLAAGPTLVERVAGCR